MEDLDRAGGIPAIINMLIKGGLVKPDVLTVTGRTIGENVSGAEVLNESVIRTLDKPYLKEGGIAILRGNLAPEGAVVKQSAVEKEMMKHTGAAKIFDSEEEAFAAIMDKRLQKGDVVVIRYEGPKGCPGMREMASAHLQLLGWGLKRCSTANRRTFFGWYLRALYWAYLA